MRRTTSLELAPQFDIYKPVADQPGTFGIEMSNPKISQRFCQLPSKQLADGMVSLAHTNPELVDTARNQSKQGWQTAGERTFFKVVNHPEIAASALEIRTASPDSLAAKAFRRFPGVFSNRDVAERLIEARQPRPKGFGAFMSSLVEIIGGSSEKKHQPDSDAETVIKAQVTELAGLLSQKNPEKSTLIFYEFSLDVNDLRRKIMSRSDAGDIRYKQALDDIEATVPIPKAEKILKAIGISRPVSLPFYPTDKVLDLYTTLGNEEDISIVTSYAKKLVVLQDELEWLDANLEIGRMIVSNGNTNFIDKIVRQRDQVEDAIALVYLDLVVLGEDVKNRSSNPVGTADNPWEQPDYLQK